MSASRSDHLALGYSSHSAGQNRSNSPSATNSPIDPLSTTTRAVFGLPGVADEDLFSFFMFRAREIQAQEGVPGLPLNPWGGPPTSGNSTPLRENIPESPTDGFPDFVQLPTPESMPPTRRARAGTVPSRFPGGIGNGLLAIPGVPAKSARVTPSQSPFNKSPSPSIEPPENNNNNNNTGTSTLLSRLRAGSMPQRSPFANLPTSASPFGPSIFSSWNPSGLGRERGSTLASIASVGSNGPSSPAQSQFSREGGGESDVHMRTLDYLGLAETPQPARAQLATPSYISNFDMTRHASRFRSYSVNNKDKYADEDDDYDADMPIDSQYAALQDQLAATQAAIHNHNMAVRAYATQATRPRARTAGVLDTPGSRLVGSYVNSNAGNGANSIPTAEIRLQEEKEYDDISQAVAGMNLGRSNSRNAGHLNPEEQGLDGPTSALWLGGIPTSTTTSTLVEMFKSHGPILSARVLTHKNCGFVNFERVESAVSAKASMNGKEIFPGAGPIRINFAKPPSASGTPGHDGAFPSPSPDPFGKTQDIGKGALAAGSGENPSAAAGALTTATPTVPPLREMVTDILDIVGEFGATDEDRARISKSLQSAVQFSSFMEEIPPVREPTHTRVHDAPKLRDIRKRIDNQMLSQAEIENIAVDMLPEIAELSSDYLGNTVVQKLFDHCSDQLRDAMLAEIAPHLAEIGIHKNGTWAAQKIIDVCKTPSQLNLIVEHLRPYTVPLFLDQYGNYVLQGCLKFGAPYNDFIFETMLSQMWEVAQGRYGARAMRACLESHHATKDQQRMLAAAIALHSVQLATNANGALLLTWFLDTCTFSNRRHVLSPRLIPYLVPLCTHKVAYLTVLKVINQKNETEARDNILKRLFISPNDQVLEAILSDQACGATFIFKVLTTPFFEETMRLEVTENVKNVLVRIKAQANQGYKRLMDEVGLSTRTAGPNREASTHAEQRQRPTSRQTNGQHGQQAGQPNKAFYNATSGASNFDAGHAQQRGENADAGAPPFPAFNQGMMYNGPNGPMPPAMNVPQLQYQQGMMNRGNPQMNYPFPPMQPGFGGYGNPGQPIDQYRQQNMPNGSPMQPAGGQPPYAPPPGFGMVGGYGYGGNMGGGPNMGYMQQEQVNGRRGRRK
ncbi:pumilio domain-containing [Trichoderma arundinaceum]|uniref:Pumilio domain-containing n=1 Tax=Trichoderma arundinaceum TaxID=490622 RepID=A0A395P0J7_TRIAR|nr:pumilio domain-containing [Trichoderma arundinaceum]